MAAALVLVALAWWLVRIGYARGRMDGELEGFARENPLRPLQRSAYRNEAGYLVALNAK